MRVGLTGGIASGKTAVADLLAAHGAVIIDADLLAREVVEPGTPGLAAIRTRFGAEVVVDGHLDRARLGELVFRDADARRDLEAIIHPLVRARAAGREAAANPDAVVVQVIPLLVETGQQTAFDLVVVVDVDPATQLERLMERNSLTRTQAEARLAAQASRRSRLDAADVIIDNSGGRDALRPQVDRLWADLQTRRPTD